MRSRGIFQLRTTPRRPAGLVLLPIVVLLMAGPAVARKKPPPPFTIVPVVGESTDVGAGAQEISVYREGLTATFSYVTGPIRRKIMEATLGIDGDPFATPPGEETRFHTFLVFLENGTGQPLHMNPSVCRVLTDNEQFAYARDYSALYQALHRTLSLEQIRKVAYDRPFILAPEGRTKKLLVFEEIPGDRWEEFSLILTLESDGIVAFDVPARFRKLYLEGPGE